MTEPHSSDRSRVSFMVWIAEVDAVIAEVLRVGFERGERVLAVQLRHELEVASMVAQDRLAARKAFHFEPSPIVAPLAKCAIEAARSRPSPTLGRIGPPDPPRS